MKLNVEDLLALEGFEHLEGPGEGPVSCISTDSRENLQDGVFLCLKGEKFDGSDFIPQALEKGARVIIGDSAKIKKHRYQDFSVTLIGVANPLFAYGKIAQYWRKKHKVSVILITGSVGKTTVKEMFTLALENQCQVVSNYKNENNEIGVPRTLLKINEATDLVILEAGMNHPGELDRIASYSLPDFVVITPICEAHIGMLGSLEKIAHAKAEVLPHLAPEGQCVVVENQKYLPLFKQYFQGIFKTVGQQDDSDYYLMDVRTLYEQVHLFTYPARLDIWAHSPRKLLHYQVRSPNYFDALNSLSIIPVLEELPHIDRDAAIETFQHFANIDLRSRIKIISDILFWVDCYNANPTSMKAALENFFRIECLGNRWLVLGEMKELGEYSEAYHREIGEYLSECCTLFHKVVFLGEQMKRAEKTFCPRSLSLYFDNCEELASYLFDKVSQGDAVFLKGSRSNHLEDILRHFLIKKECSTNDY